MTGDQAYLGAEIFDGARSRAGQALVVGDGRVRGIRPLADVPAGMRRVILPGGVLAPGYVDLQVNGGGGVMFNDAPCVETLRRMAQAHAALGATAILPTLITDTRAQVAAAIAAVKAALAAAVPGIIGLHLEGPHIAPRRKGAHDPGLIRPMEEADLAMLCAAARDLPVLMVTLAPASATPDQIRALVGAGAVVSIGHAEADYDSCMAAVGQGVSCFTHLYNAMRPLGHRDPGVVGAALDAGQAHAGLIADGIHVHPAAMRIALAAKRGPGRIFLVSDAMAPAGTDADHFFLNGRRVDRREGRLTLADGTLAGADLDLSRAVATLICQVGMSRDEALAMATAAPAVVIGRGADLGCLRVGGAADFIHLGDDGALAGVWRHGARVA
ncbi:MAG: N-acetylglucosamine-6-phosphate deacetylase [Qingshengfaniella sp.]